MDSAGSSTTNWYNTQGLLTSVSNALLVPQVLAFVLSVVEQPGRPVIDAIETFVRDRRLLLILDNCEHLIDAVAELARRLLQAGEESETLPRE